MKRLAALVIALAATTAYAQPGDPSWGVLRKLAGHTYVMNRGGPLVTTRFRWSKDGVVLREFGTLGVNYDFRDKYSREAHDSVPIALYENGYVERSRTNGGMITIGFMNPAGEFVELVCSHADYEKMVHVPTGVRGAAARSRAANRTGAEARALFERIAARPEATLGALLPGSIAQSIACDATSTPLF